MNCLTANSGGAILCLLPQRSETGLVSGNQTAQAARAVFLCAKSPKLFVMSGWAGTRKGGRFRLAVRPTCPVRHPDWSQRVGLKTHTNEVNMTNIAKNPANSRRITYLQSAFKPTTQGNITTFPYTKAAPSAATLQKPAKAFLSIHHDEFLRIEKGYVQVIAFLQTAKDADRDNRLTLDHFIDLRLATSRYANLLTNLVEHYIGIRFNDQPSGFEEQTREPILSETENAIEGAGYNLSVFRYGVKKGILKNTELVILLKVVNRLLDYIDRDICRFTRKPSQIQTIRVRSDEINAWLLEALKAPIMNGTFSLMEAHHGN